ncbi:RAMP superfamily CRISPR-associated protein [Candidatus Chloroploca sp. Khr17]|uniref:RAMP superfamily CRISPR-associated protein n=1 Tax=Candidatus Chloroploca sp. Khr17 TaxID=2496869 RepID=UPI00101D203A|nr:RAMP superfamily CRISPR-associated protein [Candidatus Chloroploca sp. Khr17]
MHKAIFLEGTLSVTITPTGPFLIKAGDTGGADPTLPDMEFVRTRHRGAPEVYIPGSSLKGVVRAQCERICRSLDGERRYDQDAQRLREHQELFVPPLADNPILKKEDFVPYRRGGNDTKFSSGIYLQDEDCDGAATYRRSAFTSQIFGNTSLAGRVRFADAYPQGKVTLEERNGVAIDRIYGSVAVGPFNYETVVEGAFTTQIDLKNLTLAQLGLLGLALRDLAEGRVAIGFGKSRGLGRISITFDALELRYPTCELVEGQLRLLNGKARLDARTLAGVGALATEGYRDYAFDANDTADLPVELNYEDDDERGMGVRLMAPGDAQVRSLFKACMPAWKRRIGL